MTLEQIPDLAQPIPLFGLVISILGILGILIIAGGLVEVKGAITGLWGRHPLLVINMGLVIAGIFVLGMFVGVFIQKLSC